MSKLFLLNSNQDPKCKLQLWQKPMDILAIFMQCRISSIRIYPEFPIEIIRSFCFFILVSHRSVLVSVSVFDILCFNKYFNFKFIKQVIIYLPPEAHITNGLTKCLFFGHYIIFFVHNYSRFFGNNNMYHLLLKLANF